MLGLVLWNALSCLDCSLFAAELSLSVTHFHFAQSHFAAAILQISGLFHFKCTSPVICKTRATAAHSDAWSLEMAGCHHERDTVPQVEDPGLSFCVGKHSPCLSILEQDTDPWQLYGGCSVADLLVEGGEQQGEFAFVYSRPVLSRWPYLDLQSSLSRFICWASTTVSAVLRGCRWQHCHIRWKPWRTNTKFQQVYVLVEVVSF